MDGKKPTCRRSTRPSYIKCSTPTRTVCSDIYPAELCQHEPTCGHRMVTCTENRLPCHVASHPCTKAPGTRG